ncbi:MAG: host-nuclease inhibitor Gam family protein [Sphingomonadaceae bacterium]|nr:host-nuclease inhibitor Gam family protein [Sphingomonadaceae bacterium]
MARRRKAGALDAPATWNEAVLCASHYHAQELEKRRLKLVADEAIASIRAERDRQLKPVELSLKEGFRRLQAWWAVAKAEVTGGKKKSTEIAGLQIGDRLSNPKLAHPGLTEEQAVRVLQDNFQGQLVRLHPALDKPAIMEALKLDTPQAAFLRKLGFTLEQTEEFFVSPIEAADPATPELREAA